MSKKALLLTRHGETEWNTVRRMQGHQDSPLTEYGVLQAKWLKERLKDTPIDVIYSSPLGRAYATAQIIAEGRNTDIICSDLLKEIYMGSWEGQLIEDIEKVYYDTNYNFWNKPNKYIPVDGESFEKLRHRNSDFYKNVLCSSEYTNILVVTHAIVLKSFIAYSTNTPIKNLWMGPHIQPTSLTKASLIGEGISYDFVGDISHHKSKSSTNGWFHDNK